MKSVFIPTLLVLLSVLSISSTTFGQLELPSDKVKVEVTLSQDGCEATISAKVTMVDHWHINSIVLPEGSFGFPSSFEMKESSSYSKIGSVREPKATVLVDEGTDELLSYHDGVAYFKQRIKIISEEDFKITGSFEYQTCNEVKCLAPYTEDFTIKVKGCEEEDLSQSDIEKSFTENKDGIAKDKSGKSFVHVNDEWHEVPEGNSAPFYKKYLTLVGSDEK